MQIWEIKTDHNQRTAILEKSKQSMIALLSEKSKQSMIALSEKSNQIMVVLYNLNLKLVRVCLFPSRIVENKNRYHIILKDINQMLNS